MFLGNADVYSNSENKPCEVDVDDKLSKCSSNGKMCQKVEEKYSSQYGKKLVKIGSEKSVPSKSSKKSLVLNQCPKKKK